MMNSLRIAMSRAMLVMMVFALAWALIGPGLTSPALAASSRAASVVDVTGTAYLKKAGGTKPYRIYKKMTVNQNDTIITEKNASLVLSIVDREDEVTIGENSEVYVADLLEKSGAAKTTLNITSGSLYSNVTSKSGSDTYRIETPNATMGVRGTHFVVVFDRLTGQVQMLVSAGVVEVRDSDNLDVYDVYPGYQSSIFDGQDGGSNIVVAPENMDDIPLAILARLLANHEEITREIEQYIDLFDEQGTPPDVANPDAYAAIIRNLLYDIARRIIEEADLDIKLIFPLEQPPDPKENLHEEAYTQEALERREQARQRQEQLAEQKERQRQEYLQNNQDALERLQQKKEEQEKANREAEELNRTKAVERYMENMTEEEQAQFRQRVEEAQRSLTGDDQEPSESYAPGDATDPGTNPGGQPGSDQPGQPGGEQPGEDDEGPGDEPGDPKPTLRLVPDSRTQGKLAVDLVMEHFPAGYHGAQFSILFDPDRLTMTGDLDSWLANIHSAVRQVFANAEVHAAIQTGTYSDPDGLFSEATELLITILSLGDGSNGPVDEAILLSIPFSLVSTDPGRILLRGVMFVDKQGNEVPYEIEVIGVDSQDS